MGFEIYDPCIDAFLLVIFINKHFKEIPNIGHVTRKIFFISFFQSIETFEKVFVLAVLPHVSYLFEVTHLFKKLENGKVV